MINAVPQGIFIKHNRDLSYRFNRGEVLFIESIRYFLNNEKIGVIRDGRKWVYNSFDKIAAHMNYSVRQVKRICSSLVKLGVLFIGRFSRGRYNKTNYYSINEEKLKQILSTLEVHVENHEVECQNVTIDGDKMSLSITENTYLDLINKSERKFTSQTSQNYIKKEIEDPNTESNQLTESESDVKIPRTTTNDMFKLWKEWFPISEDVLTKDLSRMLVAAFKKKFECNLGKWKHYLKKIESSSYLTGEKFQLTLKWVLKFTTIDRIKNNELGVQDIQDKAGFTLTEAIETIMGSADSQRVKSVRRELLQMFGAPIYKSWFLDTEIFETNEGVSFKAPSKFRQDHILNNYWCKLFPFER